MSAKFELRFKKYLMKWTNVCSKYIHNFFVLFCCCCFVLLCHIHDDVIKWKHFPRYWRFVWVIHRSPVISTHKGQLRRALMFSLMNAWTNGWVNNRNACDLRRHRAHYYVTVMASEINLGTVSILRRCHTTIGISITKIRRPHDLYDGNP